MRLVSAVLCVLPTVAMPQDLAFPKGSLGAPFSVDGLLQGCTSEGELPGCTFYADGARWIAAQGGGTPDEILAALAELPVNTPAVFHGDELNMGDITVEVALGAVDLSATDPNAELRTALQGDWVSVDDPLATLSVFGSEWFNLYDGQPMDQNLMTLGGTCPDGAAVDGGALVLQMFGGAPEDVTCFDVMDVSADTLTLLHLPRGNILTYARP